MVKGNDIANSCYPPDGIYKTKMKCLISNHSTKYYHRIILFTDFSSSPRNYYKIGIKATTRINLVVSVLIIIFDETMK